MTQFYITDVQLVVMIASAADRGFKEGAGMSIRRVTADTFQLSFHS